MFISAGCPQHVLLCAVIWVFKFFLKVKIIFKNILVVHFILVNAMFERFIRNKKGVLNVVIGSVLAVVVAAILIMISTEIVANVSNSMPAVTGAANTTITNITEGTYGGLQLMTVLPIVLAAAAIISAVVGGFMVLRVRQ